MWVNVSLCVLMIYIPYCVDGFLCFVCICLHVWSFAKYCAHWFLNVIYFLCLWVLSMSDPVNNLTSLGLGKILILLPRPVSCSLGFSLVSGWKWPSVVPYSFLFFGRRGVRNQLARRRQRREGGANHLVSSRVTFWWPRPSLPGVLGELSVVPTFFVLGFPGFPPWFVFRALLKG